MVQFFTARNRALSQDVNRSFAEDNVSSQEDRPCGRWEEVTTMTPDGRGPELEGMENLLLPSRRCWRPKRRVLVVTSPLPKLRIDHALIPSYSLRFSCWSIFKGRTRLLKCRWSWKILLGLVMISPAIQASSHRTIPAGSSVLANP
jgi:hypothetical protein